MFDVRYEFAEGRNCWRAKVFFLRGALLRWKTALVARWPWSRRFWRTISASKRNATGAELQVLCLPRTKISPHVASGDLSVRNTIGSSSSRRIGPQFSSTYLLTVDSELSTDDANWRRIRLPSDCFSFTFCERWGKFTCSYTSVCERASASQTAWHRINSRFAIEKQQCFSSYRSYFCITNNYSSVFRIHSDVRKWRTFKRNATKRNKCRKYFSHWVIDSHTTNLPSLIVSITYK